MGKSKKKSKSLTAKEKIEAIFEKATGKAYDTVHAADDYEQYQEAAVFYNKVVDALNEIEEVQPVNAVEEDAIQASLLALRESVMSTISRMVPMHFAPKEYHDAGFPLGTPEKDMTDAEAKAYWRHKARLWEARAKKSFKEANELRAFKDRLVYRGNRHVVTVSRDDEPRVDFVSYSPVAGPTINTDGLGLWEHRMQTGPARRVTYRGFDLGGNEVEINGLHGWS